MCSCYYVLRLLRLSVIMIVFQDSHVKFGEDGDAVLITELTHGDKWSVVMSLKTWSDCALEDSLLESCKVELKAGLMMFLLAT